MDKYEKAIIAIVIIVVVSTSIYAILLVFGNIGADFPFIIFFPGNAAIWIPIISRKRLEAQNKQMRSKKAHGGVD
jgi:hypothetical protein